MIENCLVITVLVMCVLIAINILMLIRDKHISINNLKVFSDNIDVLKKQKKELEGQLRRMKHIIEDKQFELAQGILYADGQQMFVTRADIEFLAGKKKEGKENG